MCLAAAPIFSFAAITQGIVAVGAAIGAVVASPIFLGAVAAVAVVAIGVIVYDKYIDSTAINRANTVQKNHNDLNNHKKFPNCRGDRGKIYCGVALTVAGAAMANMFLGDGSIGEDESPARIYPPTPTLIPTSTSTSTPNTTPTSMPTSTSTPTSIPTSTTTPTTTPSSTPKPYILPKPSNQYPAIPV